MARGTQFLQLVTDLKAETGRASSVSVGVDELDNLKTILNRWYQMLWYAYDWPFLRKRFTEDNIEAGDNLYDLPTGLDLERIDRVSVLYNGIWRPIVRGITFEDYNCWNPDADERSDPILKWDTRLNDSNVLQLEYWPMPGTDTDDGGCTIEFIGFLAWAKLVADSDVCRLDDQMVVMFAAAQILKRQKSEDADSMLAAANKHLNTLRSRTKAGETRYQIGLGDGVERRHPKATITVSSS